MSRYRFGAQLEQACVKPGHWMIEGYDVWRTVDGHESWWDIEFCGKHIGTATTLNDAREWIADNPAHRLPGAP